MISSKKMKYDNWVDRGGDPRTNWSLCWNSLFFLNVHLPRSKVIEVSVGRDYSLIVGLLIFSGTKFSQSCFPYSWKYILSQLWILLITCREQCVTSCESAKYRFLRKWLWTGFEQSHQCRSLAPPQESCTAGDFFWERSENVIARRRRCLRGFSTFFLLDVWPSKTESLCDICVMVAIFETVWMGVFK